MTDEQVSAAGPYSVEQIREHLETERDGIYQLSREGGSITVVSVLQ